MRKECLGMPARIVYSVIVLLLAGIVRSAPARAADGDAPTVVLGIEAADALDNNLATEITDALRQRVASSKGLQLVQGKDLVEIKLVFSCSDEAPSCMAQAGKSLGAAKVIYGSVKRVGAEFALSLRLLDANRATLDGQTVENIPRRRGEPSALRAMSAQWLARLGGKSGGGVLTVRSNVAGATVSLDGAAVGVTGQQPLSVADVAPGKHEIVVQKAGYASATQQFTMAGSQALPLSLTLIAHAADGSGAEREPDASLAQRSSRSGDLPADDGSQSLARPGFWIAMVLTAASLGAATWFGLEVRRINGDLDQYRQVPCTSSPSGYCTTTGAPIADPQRSLDQKNAISRKLDDADSAHRLQWVFVGVGSAFAIAGGFLLYKGFLDKESGGGSRTSDNHGLRIFPTANASSGGVVAEFDF
jgi:hypothetical protein